MSSIKLLTLNVEINKHWDTVLPFLERESPEVLCLQELFDKDAEMLAKRFGYDYVQIPMTKKRYDPKSAASLTTEGPALLTTLPLKNKNRAYYYEAAPEIQIFKKDTPATMRATTHHGIVWGTVTKGNAEFTIASTHFTWTPDGKPNENQDRDLPVLFKILDGIPALVLCGDFNAPRGANRIYQALAGRFKDNVPENIETTLDLQYHRVRNDPVNSERVSKLVIDYIFSTPEYEVSDVRRVCGVSDHCALLANISRHA